MHRGSRRVADERVLELIHRYLQAGVMLDGVKQATAEGTAHGCSLSPLLSGPCAGSSGNGREPASVNHAHLA